MGFGLVLTFVFVQEGVKILTGQFVPIHNTVVYNAVSGGVSHWQV